MPDGNPHAVIFDLDGVITDTAEFHYLGWQQLADEEGLPFDRNANEALRGLSRRESLQTILGDQALPESRFEEMLERKNRYYVAHLADMTPEDVLPGAVELVVDARRRGMPVAIGSSSKNARRVLDALELTDLFDAVADGTTVEQAKPAPDLFLAAADLLGVDPARCIVVEDAGSGVDAALAAGMVAVGIGPSDRVGHAHHRYDRVADADLAEVVPAEEAPFGGARLHDGWIVVDDPVRGQAPVLGTGRPVGDGRLTLEDGGAEAADRGHLLRLVGPEAVVPWLPVPLLRWTTTGGAAALPTTASVGTRHELDLRHGRSHRELLATDGTVREVVEERFVAREHGGVLVHRQRLRAEAGARLVLTSGVDRRGWPPAGEDVEPLVAAVQDDGIMVVTRARGPSGEEATLAVGLTVDGAAVAEVRDDLGDDHAARRLVIEIDDEPLVVRQVVSVGPGGAEASDRTAERTRAVLAAGHEPLLARHVIAWERQWVDAPTSAEDRCRRYLQAATGGATGRGGA